MLLGLEIGLDSPYLAERFRILSDIFLWLIKVIVAPLILGTLITGIAGHGDLRKLGRIGLKSLVYFEAATTIALLIGVAAINLTKAGSGLVLTALAREQSSQDIEPLRWGDFLLHLFPENIVKAVAENQILQVAVFAVLFAIALSQIPEKTREPILNLTESLTQTMFRLTSIIMHYAPIGVGAAMTCTVGHLGINALLPLGKLVLTAYGAFIALLLFVFLPIVYFSHLPIRRLLQALAEPAAIAFATSASGAELPCAMERMQQFGVPRRIVALVIPAGYSFNMDGGTVYLAVASVFVAQAAGIHMSWSAQLLMIFTLMLTSKGIAGVPRATLVILSRRPRR
jgi:proton glutamate symport protein